jgi:Phage integrase, N-terminal SAM-like domain
VLIKDLSADYLERLANRKCKKVNPATLAAFGSYVRNHINPRLGDLEVASVRNGVVKRFAEDLVRQTEARGDRLAQIYEVTV